MPRHLASALLLATGLLAIVSPLAAQTPVRGRAMLPAGLPQNSYECVYQDENEFVWFCSGDGLVRFDGYAAVVFPTGAPGASSAIHTLLRTRDGRHLAGSESGLLGFVTDAGAPGTRRFSQLAIAGRPIGPIYALIEARDGAIWCGSADGLIRLTAGMQGLTPDTVDLALGSHSKQPSVLALLEDERGALWIGSTSGLYRRGPDGVVLPVLRADGTPVGQTQALALDPLGRLWVGTPQGISRIDRLDAAVPALDERPLASIPYRSRLSRINVLSLMASGETLWVGTTSTIYVVQNIPGQVPKVLTEWEGIHAHALAADAGGNVWAATPNGGRLLVGIRHNYDNVIGLKSRNVASVFESREDGVCATVSRPSFELHCFDGQQFRRIAVHVADTLTPPSGRGQLAMQDRRGRWFILTREGLLQFAAGRAGDLASAWPETVYTTARYRHLWHPGYSEWARLVPDSAHLTLLLSAGDLAWEWPKIISSKAAYRHLLPARDRAWAWPEIVYNTAHRGQIVSIAPELPSLDIDVAFGDSRGDLWFVTRGVTRSDVAVVRAEMGVTRLFGDAHGLPRQLGAPCAFAEDRSGHVWLGISDGRLLRFRDGRFEEVLAHGALAASSFPRETSAAASCLLLIEDGGGLLFLPAGPFSFRVDRPEALRPEVVATFMPRALPDPLAAVEDALDAPWMRYIVNTGGVARQSDAASGFFPVAQGGRVNSAIRDRDGSLWFATTQGVVRRSEAERARSRPAPTVVTAVSVNGEATPMPSNGTANVGGITLGPETERIEVEFVSPRAASGERIRYQQKLPGNRDAWANTDARVVIWPNVVPGTYDLIVRAVTDEDVAGPSAHARFVVLAPVWRRWWFRTLAIAGVLGLALAFHRVRVSRLVAVERERSRIAADLHDGIGASLSRIALLSDVVRQKTGTQVPEAAPELASIGENARSVIDDMSDAVWFIDSRVEDLQQLVVRIRGVAASLFDCTPVAWTVEAPDGLAAVPIAREPRRHAYLATKEALTNAHRHARAATVGVRITVRGRRLRIVIHDDGIGFDGRGADGRREGRGLASLRERARTAAGEVTIDSSTAGTRIVLEVPLH